MNSRRRIRDPPSRFMGSLSRPRMEGNGYVTGLVIKPRGRLLPCTGLLLAHLGSHGRQLWRRLIGVLRSPR
jgi:hypothetical protein